MVLLKEFNLLVNGQLLSVRALTLEHPPVQTAGNWRLAELAVGAILKAWRGAWQGLYGSEEGYWR